MPSWRILRAGADAGAFSMIVYGSFPAGARAVLGAAALAGMHYSAAAEVQFTRQLEMVDLQTSPTLPNSLIMDMTRVMPKVGNEHALAVTRGEARWHYKTRSYGGLCSVHSVVVEMQTRMRLPEWPRWREAPQIWQDAWTCIDKYLVAHENTHADIWRETADDIDAALAELARPSSCEGFSERARATAQQAYDLGSRKQKAFDAGQKRFDDVNKCIAEFVASAAPEKKTARDAAAKAASATAESEPGATPQADGWSAATAAARDLQQRFLVLGAAGMLVLGVLGAGFKVMLRSSADAPVPPPAGGRGDGSRTQGERKLPARTPKSPVTPARGEFAARARARKP